MKAEQPIQSIKKSLAEAELFNGVGIEYFEHLIEGCELITIPVHHELISPASLQRQLYILARGELSVFVDAGKQMALTTLRPGQCAGEMSIIEDTVPSATVVAKSACELVVISDTVMWQLINTSHAFSLNFLIVLSRRLRFDNEHVTNSADIIQQYMRNAVTDPLTDLKNRYWMKKMFTRRISRAARESEPLCLAILDLDNFKLLNDQFGHQAGDLVLQSVADCLRDLFRPSDLIARYGGDEFVVLLTDSDRQHALDICERVKTGIQQRLRTEFEQYSDVTVTIGVAQLTGGMSLETLTKNADDALYAAKHKGRNRVGLFSS